METFIHFKISYIVSFKDLLFLQTFIGFNFLFKLWYKNHPKIMYKKAKSPFKYIKYTQYISTIFLLVQSHREMKQTFIALHELSANSIYIFFFLLFVSSWKTHKITTKCFSNFNDFHIIYILFVYILKFLFVFILLYN